MLQRIYVSTRGDHLLPGSIKYKLPIHKPPTDSKKTSLNGSEDLSSAMLLQKLVTEREVDVAISFTLLARGVYHTKQNTV